MKRTGMIRVGLVVGALTTGGAVAGIAGAAAAPSSTTSTTQSTNNTATTPKTQTSPKGSTGHPCPNMGNKSGSGSSSGSSSGSVYEGGPPSGASTQ